MKRYFFVLLVTLSCLPPIFAQDLKDRVEKTIIDFQKTLNAITTSNDNTTEDNKSRVANLTLKGMSTFMPTHLDVLKEHSDSSPVIKTEPPYELREYLQLLARLSHNYERKLSFEYDHVSIKELSTTDKGDSIVLVEVFVRVDGKNAKDEIRSYKIKEVMHLVKNKKDVVWKIEAVTCDPATFSWQTEDSEPPIQISDAGKGSINFPFVLPYWDEGMFSVSLQGGFLPLEVPLWGLEPTISFGPISLSLGFGMSNAKVLQPYIPLANMPENTVGYSYKKSDKSPYLILSPGFIVETYSDYLRYLSLNLGVGMQFAKLYSNISQTIVDDDMNVFHDEMNSIHDVLFSLRPMIRGYFEIDYDWSIILDVGYSIALSEKSYSSLVIGIGLGYNIYY